MNDLPIHIAAFVLKIILAILGAIFLTGAAIVLSTRSAIDYLRTLQ
jgi:hypothetical protein